MRGVFTLIILIFEILGLIITLVERKEKIKWGYTKARNCFKDPPKTKRSTPNVNLQSIKNYFRRK